DPPGGRVERRSSRGDRLVGRERVVVPVLGLHGDRGCRQREAYTALRRGAERVERLDAVRVRAGPRQIEIEEAGDVWSENRAQHAASIDAVTGLGRDVTPGEQEPRVGPKSQRAGRGGGRLSDGSSRESNEQ